LERDLPVVRGLSLRGTKRYSAEDPTIDIVWFKILSDSAEHISLTLTLEAGLFAVSYVEPPGI
jgi:hypothetical protein